MQLNPFVYTEDLKVRTSACDFMDTMKPSSILEAFQEVAGQQCMLAGVGSKNMLRQNRAWVLVQVEAQVQTLPTSGQLLEVSTFPGKVRHSLFPRYSIIRDKASGEALIYGSSIWVVMDMTTRQAIHAEDIANLMEKPEDVEVPQIPMKSPSSVRLLDGETEIHEFQALVSDLDVNRHVNNVKYMDWCLNALGEERVKTMQVKQFAVEYTKEIRPASYVTTELCVQDSDFSFFGREGDERHFMVSGRLEPRNTNE